MPGNFLPMIFAVCYPEGMIRRLVKILSCLLIAAGWAWSGAAATFSLNDGQTISGDVSSGTAQGLILRKGEGDFTPRIPWTNFTQSALKQLSSNPKIKLFVESYLELDEPEPASTKQKAITADPKIPERMQRPDPKAGMGGLFKNALTLTLIFLIYAANVYAGFEVAMFRNYSPLVGCGVAAVAPILGLIVFLCLPTRLQKSHDELAAESMAHHAPEPVAHAHGHAHGAHEAPAEAAAPAAPAAPQAVVYLRGQTTFNRRFFETKFAGFLRMVPGEAERDKVIEVKSSRGDYVGSRLARVQPAEIYLQVTKGGASSEVMIPFTEILEVKVRQREPQDA